MTTKSVVVVIALQCLLAVGTILLPWGSFGQPATRDGIVAELTLTATILGFVGASTALIWAVQTARETFAPPRLELIPQDGSEITYNLPPVGSGLQLQNYGVSLPIQLRNVGTAHCQVHKIAASAVIVKTRRRGWSVDSKAFSVRPSSVPGLLFGDLDLDWVEESGGEWAINTPFTLMPDHALTLPGFMIQPSDLTAASDVLWFSPRVAFRLTLGVHTHRGSVRLMTEIPIVGVRPPRNTVP